MRKIALAITSALIILGMAIPSDAALRANNGPSIMYGTKGNDSMYGGRGPDVMYGLAGNDRIITGKGGPGDKAYGGPGNDRLNNWASGSAPGLLNGGRGYDVCIGDKHDTFRSCEVIKFRKNTWAT